MIVIAGAPCAGKGAQCALLAARFGMVHISTGDMVFRALCTDLSLIYWGSTGGLEPLGTLQGFGSTGGLEPLGFPCVGTRSVVVMPTFLEMHQP